MLELHDSLFVFQLYLSLTFSEDLSLFKRPEKEIVHNLHSCGEDK